MSDSVQFVSMIASTSVAPVLISGPPLALPASQPPPCEPVVALATALATAPATALATASATALATAAAGGGAAAAGDDGDDGDAFPDRPRSRHRLPPTVPIRPPSMLLLLLLLYRHRHRHRNRRHHCNRPGFLGGLFSRTLV